MAKKANFFWASYADLMTSLFFIMLVLFILTVVMLKKEQGRIVARLVEYEKIDEIKDAINNLNPKYFRYDGVNKRHELLVDINFASSSAIIDDQLTDRQELYYAGLEIRNIKERLRREDVKYLVIIEGMAARYSQEHLRHRNENPSFIANTYDLSYRRARAIYDFWSGMGINFDDDVFEIILGGSGWFGVGRHSGAEEGNNKRVLIQIIPKVGTI
jgi:hypothetical protein